MKVGEGKGEEGEKGEREGHDEGSGGVKGEGERGSGGIAPLS